MNEEEYNIKNIQNRVNTRMISAGMIFGSQWLTIIYNSINKLIIYKI